MTTIFFIIFVVFLAFVLLLINILLAPHTYSADKSDAFECGFSSFRGQNRSEFNVSFFIFGLIFLLLDLEILLVYPYAVSSYNNSYYGALFVIVFIILLTVGFVFELGKGALKLNSKQTGYLKSSSALYSAEQRSGKGNSNKNLNNKQGHFLGTWGKRFYVKLVYAIKIKDLKFKVSYQGRKL
jgi:NADH-ubiquinone oxidoreductase chain 3